MIMNVSTLFLPAMACLKFLKQHKVYWQISEVVRHTKNNIYLLSNIITVIWQPWQHHYLISLVEFNFVSFNYSSVSKPSKHSCGSVRHGLLYRVCINNQERTNCLYLIATPPAPPTRLCNQILSERLQAINIFKRQTESIPWTGHIHTVLCTLT